MAKGKSNDSVSVWFWMFALFVTSLPCVGLVMTIVWALVGENESRKNFFRAILAWMAIGMVLWIGLVTLGFWPEIQKQIQKQIQSLSHRQ